MEELVKGGMVAPDAAALWAPGGKNYVEWARMLFFVPALAGGVFGLLGGYLTDRSGDAARADVQHFALCVPRLPSGYATR